MNKHDLEERTRKFAIEVIRFTEQFPRSQQAKVVCYQLVKAGSSIGANYREVNRAESRNDFIHKLAIAEKEASESQYWLQICRDLPMGKPDHCKRLLKENSELLAIFTSARRTTRLN